MKKRKISISDQKWSGLFALVILFSSERSFGIPAFASYEGTSCATCHVNPTGGGMRTDMGFVYCINEMPLSEKSKIISPKITEDFKFGVDFRQNNYFAQSIQFQRTKNTFITMQGDIYLHYSLGENLEFYLDKGLYEGFEIMGILSKGKSYLKIGKFLPPYGLRFDDHNVYTQAFTPFAGGGYSRGEDAGLEIGYVNDHWITSLAVQNGSPGSGFQIDIGEDEGKALTLGIKGFQKNFLLGGSYYRNFQRFPGSELESAGGHGGVHYGDFNLLTQVDYLILRDAPSDTINSKDIVSHTEARFRARQGIDLLLQYDFYDKDSVEKFGEADYERISFGTSLFPIRYIEVLVLLRHNLTRFDFIENRKVFGTPEDAWESNLLFHLFF